MSTRRSIIFSPFFATLRPPHPTSFPRVCVLVLSVQVSGGSTHWATLSTGGKTFRLIIMDDLFHQCPSYRYVFHAPHFIHSSFSPRRVVVTLLPERTSCFLELQSSHPLILQREKKKSSQMNPNIFFYSSFVYKTYIGMG